jgi:hypothetical protein
MPGDCGLDCRGFLSVPGEHLNGILAMGAGRKAARSVDEYLRLGE